MASVETILGEWLLLFTSALDRPSDQPNNSTRQSKARMKFARSTVLSLLVLAVCALSLVLIGVNGSVTSRLPSRPSPPDHGRFQHQAEVKVEDEDVVDETINGSDATSSLPASSPSIAANKLQRSSARGQGTDGHPRRQRGRRFHHAMVINSHGEDVTNEMTVPDSFESSVELADEINPRGLSLLKYDVQFADEARVFDEDMNVLQIVCQRSNAATTVATDDGNFTLTVTVANMPTALSTYEVDTVVHGSTMWSCHDPTAPNQLWTILLKLTAVTVIDENTLQLDGVEASYQDLFTSAQVLLRQPSLQTPLSQSATPPPSRSHPLAIDDERYIKLGIDSRREERETESSARRMRLMNNELSFTSPEKNLDFQPTDSVHIAFNGYSKIPNYADRTKLILFTTTIGSDDEIGSIKAPDCQTPRVDDTCEFTVALSLFNAKPRLRSYYFQLEYCKTILGITTCDRSETNQFWIPLTVSDIYETNGLKTYEKSCTTLATAGTCALNNTSTVDKQMCKLCKEGRDMSMYVSCTDCKVGYTTQISSFSLGYSLDPLDLYIRAETVVDAYINGNIHIGAGITYQQLVSGSMTVVSDLPIPPSISIPLGSITMVLGAAFSLGASYSIDFKAQAKVNMEAHLNNVITARAVYDSRLSPAAQLTGSIPPFSFSQQPVINMDASGALTVGVSLIPSLKVGITHLIAATAQTELNVRVDSDFSWPPFPAIQTGVYDHTPSKPSYAHYGNCSAPHLIQYGVTAGLINSFVAARLEFDVGSSISNLLQKFDTSRDLGRKDFSDLTLPLVSGCLLKQKSSDPIVIQLNIKPTDGIDFSLGFDLPLLRYNISADLSKALNVSSARFIIELLDNAGNYLDDFGKIKQKVKDALSSNALPHTSTHTARLLDTDTTSIARSEVIVLDGDANQPTASQLAVDIRTQASTPNSPLLLGGTIQPTAPSEESSSSADAGVIAGAVIGTVCGVAIIAVLAYYLLVIRPRASKDVNVAKGSSVPSKTDSPVVMTEISTVAVANAQPVPLRPVPPLSSVTLANIHLESITLSQSTLSPSTSSLPLRSPPPLPTPIAQSPSYSNEKIAIATPPPPRPPTIGKLDMEKFKQFQQKEAVSFV